MIELLVGMIASGKSTYARRRAKEGALIVSHDDLTQMLHGEYRYEQKRRALYRRIENMLVAKLGDSCYSVVIDRTHLTVESRKRWTDFVHGRHWTCGKPEIVAVVFPVESAEIHARRRFESDPRGRSHEDWLRVAEHHASQWAAEPIGDTEGFDEIIRLGTGLTTD